MAPRGGRIVSILEGGYSLKPVPTVEKKSKPTKAAAAKPGGRVRKGSKLGAGVCGGGGGGGGFAGNLQPHTTPRPADSKYGVPPPDQPSPTIGGEAAAGGPVEGEGEKEKERDGIGAEFATLPTDGGLVKSCMAHVRALMA